MMHLEPSWEREVAGEFEKPYWHRLRDFVHSEYRTTTVYPPPRDIFRALAMCPFEKVRVVIVGQDPYHGVGQANGLAFSVSRGASLPPSLRNIYKELYDDCGIPPATHGDLSAWAEQGVLLLNATLTVRAHTAGSHQGKGWETYTDALLDSLAQKRDGIVFLLWGAYAQKKTALLDFSRHMVLTAPHPSPFSAHTGFFGCRHFGKTNRFLRARGLPPIEWQLPS